MIGRVLQAMFGQLMGQLAHISNLLEALLTVLA